MAERVNQRAIEEIRRNLRAFVEADVSGESDVLARYITEDVVWMPPGDGIVEGKPAVLAYLEEHKSPPGLTVTPVEIEASEDLASLRGTFQADVGDIRITGKMAQQWRRHSDSEWRISRDIWNLDPAG